MSELTPHMLWSIASVVLIAPLAWFLKGSLDRIASLETGLRETREALLRDYATKGEIATDFNRLLDRFDKLEAKLDRIFTRQAGG